jgi:hypothetical protein
MERSVNRAAILACTAGDQNRLKELASLARLVTFAQQSAKELNVEFPAYCLDLALGALVQEIQSGTPGGERVAHTLSVVH